MNERKIKDSLPMGTFLQGKTYSYKIEKVLGQGSFGIAYLATMYYQTKIGNNMVGCQKNVALKEFFMKDINGREGTAVTDCSGGRFSHDYKLKFEREAKNLRYMVHPHVVQVYDYFEANDTAYYSMEYLQNGSLDDKIRRLGKLDETEAVRHIREIGLALSYMHDYKMLHLDLKPSNILLNDDDEAVLIDFGLSKQYDDSGKPETSTTVGKGTPGYAPIEQANYHDGDDFPVTMDVYALGATLFKMLTGHRPPVASEILNEGFPAYELQEVGVSDHLISVVARSLNPIKRNRIQTVEEVMELCRPSSNIEKADELERLGDIAYANGESDKAVIFYKACFSEDCERANVAYQIAEMYEDGRGVEKDVKTATSWYLRAAKLGHAQAQADVGEIYSQGEYVPQNNAFALKWLRIAADNGFVRAQVELADMYYNGSGCPKDFVEAARWYESVVALDSKHSVAIYALGWMYEHGEGVEQDYIRASQLYSLVADSHNEEPISKILSTALGVPDCMFRLGYFYQHGLGVELDFSQAFHYYQKAAKYNHASAMFNLGCMYYAGEGIGINRQKAVELWHEAANVEICDGDEISSGGLSAMFNLGICYEMGDGCDRDYNLAMEWYLKALSYNHEKAQSAIDSLKAELAKETAQQGLWGKIKKIFS